MIVHELHDLCSPGVSLLRTALYKIERGPAWANYHPSAAENPANLFYVLDQGRYAPGSGKYYVLEDRGQVAAAAGWNHYPDDPSLALVLTRAWVAQEYRLQFVLAHHLLPLMLKEARDYDKIWITCNDYNRTIYTWFEQAARGHNPGNWPQIYRQFQPIGKKIVYHTPQWVAEFKGTDHE